MLTDNLLTTLPVELQNDLAAQEAMVAGGSPADIVYASAKSLPIGHYTRARKVGATRREVEEVLVFHGIEVPDTYTYLSCQMYLAGYTLWLRASQSHEAYFTFCREGREPRTLARLLLAGYTREQFDDLDRYYAAKAFVSQFAEWAEDLPAAELFDCWKRHPSMVNGYHEVRSAYRRLDHGQALRLVVLSRDDRDLLRTLARFYEVGVSESEIRDALKRDLILLDYERVLASKTEFPLTHAQIREVVENNHTPFTYHYGSGDFIYQYIRGRSIGATHRQLMNVVRDGGSLNSYNYDRRCGCSHVTARRRCVPAPQNRLT